MSVPHKKLMEKINQKFEGIEYMTNDKKSVYIQVYIKGIPNVQTVLCPNLSQAYVLSK